MMSSSGETTPDSTEDFEDAEEEEHSFENPNYRKLYAALSITSMMGQNNDHNKHCSENQQLIEEQMNLSINDELPIGWERHEDESGPYYWHIPSGTIQRDPPLNEKVLNTKRNSLIYFDNFDENMVFNQSENNCDENDIQNGSSLTVLVHSLGWMEVDESQLTSATSSKVIQKCIIELSTRGDNNAVRCWGKETQELVLKVENSCLKLYDRSSDTLLNCQPIASIRVWGVNDNNDFAFVAKDWVQNDETSVGSNELTQMSPLLPISASNGLKCHVFHCEEDDNSAQRIATYLRDELIKLKALNCPKTPHNQRPKHLFIYDSSCSQGSTVATPTAIEFPTPIEEPRKTISAKYLGKTPVPKPMGIDVLNKAIETVLYKDLNEKSDPSVKRCDFPALVHISPSNIIIENKETNECVTECRVRYLSFMGIGSHSVRLCGFIVQIDDNQFEAHCFECEPSSGAFCKTIEAACRLRYQKCLDAHRARLAADNASSPTQQNSSGIKSTILNVFSKISNIRKS